MTIQEQKQALRELLKIHYGYDDFRAGQEQVIDNLLDGESTLVIMPTGGGKSLCYQLPALIWEGVTIVVSPLIALMKDQVDNLNRIGIPATFINSSISANETSNRLAEIKEGRFKLLYIAPERFYSKEFIDALSQIKVSLFAVDEAHCISSWGHDFRPSYLRLRQAVEFLGNPPVVALTATATPQVRDDIVKQLALSNPRQVVTGFARPNLTFAVVRANEGQKPGIVLEAVQNAPDGAGIIYVGTRSRAEQLMQALLDSGVEAIMYHGGMEPNERKWVQESFMKNKARVIVATNAFGLGIDKPDIRFVVHYDMPGTIEAYYQEAGRAGRDGQPSFCLMLYNSRDRALQEFFIKGDNPSPEMIFELYEVLLSYDSDSVLVTYSELMGLMSDNAPDMAIGTAIKILEREGLIRRSQEKSANAYLKLLKPASEARKVFGPRSKNSQVILDQLLAKHGHELDAGFNFNLEELAGVLGVKKESLRRVIKKIQDEGCLDYQPPFKGTEIHILKRLDRQHLNIDVTALKVKLSHAYEKLDQMEDYVYHLGCRQHYILDYFGSQGTLRCGKCDNCVNSQSDELPEEPDFQPFSDATDKHEASSPSLGTKLTQLETLELYQKGLGLDEIAQTRNLKPATIVDHFCFLLEKGMKVNVGDFVSEDSRRLIMEAVESVGGSKLGLIKEKLGENFSWNDIKLVLSSLKSKK
ncbi:RecQ family ATP-dependent DNA helicase [Candidatus Falkowbacteria bacterium]|nr:RecQ family ATP-dependent DNA helicase [Candidatus Falkowbacteria bacterium]